VEGTWALGGEVAGDWKKLRGEELHVLNCWLNTALYYLSGHMEDDEMGGICACMGEKGFGWNTW